MPWLFVGSVRDSLQALNRVVSLLRARNFRVTSVSIVRSELVDVSRLVVVVDDAQAQPQRVASCLEKLEEAWNVVEVDSTTAVRRAVALVKLNEPIAKAPVSEMLASGRARLVERKAGVTILEISGAPEEVDETIGTLPREAILEIARPGDLVMARGEKPTTSVTSSTDVSWTRSDTKSPVVD